MCETFRLRLPASLKSNKYVGGELKRQKEQGPANLLKMLKQTQESSSNFQETCFTIFVSSVCQSRMSADVRRDDGGVSALTNRSFKNNSIISKVMKTYHARVYIGAGKQ